MSVWWEVIRLALIVPRVNCCEFFIIIIIFFGISFFFKFNFAFLIFGPDLLDFCQALLFIKFLSKLITASVSLAKPRIFGVWLPERFRYTGGSGGMVIRVQ